MSARNTISFRITRLVSWVSLGVILATSLILAVVIGNMARTTLIERQQQYALLMAENLNQQMYRRFVWPTIQIFGQISLRNEEQFARLDEIIRSSIFGLPQTLRIFDTNGLVSYSIDAKDLGRKDLAPTNLRNVFGTGKPTFELLSNIKMLHAFFTHPLPEGSFVMRTTFPLSAVAGKLSEENSSKEAPTIGVLVLSQDITEDYNTTIRFQWILIATCLGIAAVLFLLLQLFIGRAERIMAARMQRTQMLEKTLRDNEIFVSMGRIIASIAHEIRNPLGIIRSSSELLLKRAENDNFTASSRAVLTAIYDESCRLSRTVNDFLDYARPRQPRQSPVDCALLIEQALTFLHTEFTKNSVELITQIESPLPVLGDKDLIYRAIYNILVNALQAIGDTGIIRLRTQRTSDNKILIEIHDTGPGFPDLKLTNVLEPFFTTKDNGTGLGLPIVNTIITSHSGTLQLDNAAEEHGGGAIVRMYLPMDPQAIPLTLHA